MAAAAAADVSEAEYAALQSRFRAQSARLERQDGMLAALRSEVRALQDGAEKAVVTRAEGKLEAEARAVDAQLLKVGGCCCC